MNITNFKPGEKITRYRSVRIFKNGKFKKDNSFMNEPVVLKYVNRATKTITIEPLYDELQGIQLNLEYKETSMDRWDEGWTGWENK